MKELKKYITEAGADKFVKKPCTAKFVDYEFLSAKKQMQIIKKMDGDLDEIFGSDDPDKSGLFNYSKKTFNTVKLVSNDMEIYPQRIEMKEIKFDNYENYIYGDINYVFDVLLKDGRERQIILGIEYESDSSFKAIAAEWKVFSLFDENGNYLFCDANFNWDVTGDEDNFNLDQYYLEKISKEVSKKNYMEFPTEFATAFIENIFANVNIEKFKESIFNYTKNKTLIRDEEYLASKK